MTTPLTAEQKAAGRAFRAHWRELLARLNREFPVTTDSCSAHVAWYRHDCPGRGSQALFLHQQYAPSPRYLVHQGRDHVWRTVAGGLNLSATEVPEGLFVFYYRQGRCTRCGFSVRTEGDFDLAENCPMEKGAVLHAPDQLPAVRAD